jgi:hypothetical protein
MSLTPLTEKQQASIVKNIVLACDDIYMLNQTGYKFIHNCSGFIAHYDLDGFIDYYSENDLRTDIIRNALSNRYNNFKPGDQNYEYYKSKAKIYADIVEQICPVQITT